MLTYRTPNGHRMRSFLHQCMSIWTFLILLTSHPTVAAEIVIFLMRQLHHCLKIFQGPISTFARDMAVMFLKMVRRVRCCGVAECIMEHVFWSPPDRLHAWGWVLGIAGKVAGARANSSNKTPTRIGGLGNNNNNIGMVIKACGNAIIT